jgi:lysozyme
VSGAVAGPTPLPPAISRELLADLKRDEGCRFNAYPDPISGSAPWTIGFGHASAAVHPGLVWSMAECEAALIADILEAQRQLDARLAWWRTLDSVRRDALTNLAFNLGVEKLLTFTTTLAALKAGDWRRAADALLRSRYAVQVKGRAGRLAQMLASGAR